jgi:hypothetical protein
LFINQQLSTYPHESTKRRKKKVPKKKEEKSTTTVTFYFDATHHWIGFPCRKLPGIFDLAVCQLRRTLKMRLIDFNDLY